jgi:putative ABC transport system permease protein
VCLITLTGYRAAANNPCAHEERPAVRTRDRQLGPGPAVRQGQALEAARPSHYRDAEALVASDIPDRKVIMYKVADVISREDGGMEPETIIVRATTHDFFAMFETPFQYGGGWDVKADQGPEPVIVLSKGMNDRAFKGANSVGKSVRWHDRDFRVIGVLAEWQPAPKFYDVSNGAFEDVEDAFIPFAFGKQFELGAAGNTNCWKTETIDSFERFTQSECIWQEVWVELRSADKERAYREFLDNYVTAQKKLGRFPRPLNNCAVQRRWLAEAQPAWYEYDNKAMLTHGVRLPGGCLVNTVGLQLAKFLNAPRPPPGSGARSARAAATSSCSTSPSPAWWRWPAAWSAA